MFKQIFLFFQCLPQFTQKKILWAFPITFLAALFELLFIISLIPMLNMLSGTMNNGLYGFFPDFICSSDKECDTNIIFISITVMLLATVIRMLSLKYITELAYKISHEVGSGIFFKHLFKDYKNLKMESNAKLQADILSKSNLILGDVSSPVLHIISSTFTVIFILIALLISSSLLSVVSFVLLLLMYVIVIELTKRKLPTLSEQYKLEQEAVYQTIMESNELVREVRHYQLESHFLSKFQKSDSVLKEVQSKIAFTSMAPRYLVEALGIIILLSIGIFYKFHNNASVINELGILAISFLRLLPNIQNIYQGLYRIKSSNKILLDVISLLSEHIDYRKKSHEIFDKEIKLIDVSYSVDGQEILKNIDLTVSLGEKIAIYGESGSGKSTLLDLITGLVIPNSGRVLIDGKEFSGFNNSKNHILSIIDQDPKFITDSIEESILFSIGSNQDIKKNIIENDLIEKFYNLFSLNKDYGLWKQKKNNFLGDHGSNMSGGQKQRLKIVQALVMRPKILLADEPTSALDDENTDLVLEEICNKNKYLTVLCTIHDQSKLKFFDKIIYMRQGKITKIVNKGKRHGI